MEKNFESEEIMNRREDLKKVMRTPKDISESSNEDKADTLTLHFIVFLAKPIGIDEILYQKCLEAFNNNRGQYEWECEAILNVLNSQNNDSKGDNKK